MKGGDVIKKKVAKNYIQQLCLRYDKENKKEKHIILNELTQTAGNERKYAINLLWRNYKHTEGKISRPRKRIYTVVDALVLTKVCELFDWINSKRVRPQIGIAIDSLVQAGELLCKKE